MKSQKEGKEYTRLQMSARALNQTLTSHLGHEHS